MATDQQVNLLRDNLNNVVVISTAEADYFWANVDKTDPKRLQADTITFMQDVIATYGDMSAGIAADWFDEVRDTSPAVAGVSTFRAVAAPPLPAEQIAGSTGWALSTDEPMVNLDGVLDRLIKQQGRDTIVYNTERDHARYARVPRGKTCAFCLLLASRGPVYGSKRSAGEGKKFHAHCDCVIVPVWTHADLPHGYDPDELYKTYQQGRDIADSGSTKDVLAGIRTATGYSH